MKKISILFIVLCFLVLGLAGCSSQIPPIFASLSNNGGNFKIVAIRKGSTLDQELITGPKSKASIHTVADLKGKKVAYVKSTTAQYFLFRHGH